MRRALLAVAMTAGLGTVQAHPAAAAPADEVRITHFLGEQRLPHMGRFQGTTVGGLSGIDRDPLTGTWYFISDDRARYNPARYYTGRMDINPLTRRFEGVSITGVTTLLRPDGTPYPGYGMPEAADPEAIRFDPWSRRILWSNEGDRPKEGTTGTPVVQMSLRWVDRGGHDRGGLPIPGNLRMTDTTSGPRRNAGFEGLTLTPHGVAAIVEGPRYEDGDLMTTERGAPARITVWDRRGRTRAQYAYPIDRLPAAPVPETGRYDGGVSEILAVDDNRLLSLERFWIEGVGYRVKLYEIDLRGATNVLGRNSLTGGVPYRAVTKRLVHDFNAGGATVQNLESLGWGPRLASGERVLIVGSDDNFDDREITQFLAFAVRGC
ncbi:esterase-like activity of phytase family protein [Streptosporangium algeriense]|uniref:Esterase-like activity of phytase family protein n=1 Tax=Streptosporangium algeriense TaxID=1682748 RepID=A0ABW3DTE9_9ACTN